MTNKSSHPDQTKDQRNLMECLNQSLGWKIGIHQDWMKKGFISHLASLKRLKEIWKVTNVFVLSATSTKLSPQIEEIG